ILIPEESQKIFNELDKKSDWSEGELNVARFELSICDLYTYIKKYYKNFSPIEKLSGKDLHSMCVGLVGRIGGEGVRDPIIVYLELLKSGENTIDKENFIKKFNPEKIAVTYEDPPDPSTIGKDFFDYCFFNLKRAGLIETRNQKGIKVRNILSFGIENLIKDGKRYDEGETIMTEKESIPSLFLVLPRRI
ncbi:hypothetical protein MUP35_01420, partial [Patescibacteria group bacterium]|nr:hypothetical protein [Patescibacteria group bacterium]